MQNSYLADFGSTGFTITFTDFFYSAALARNSAGTASWTDIRVYYGRQLDGYAMDMTATGGTNTVSRIQVWGSPLVDFPLKLQPGGGTNTFDQWFIYGSTTGVVIAPTGGTNTITNIKSCHNIIGVGLGGTVAVNITNLIVLACDQVFSGSLTGSSMITRLIAHGSAGSAAALQGVRVNPGAGVIYTFTEPYIGGPHYVDGLINDSLVYTRCIVSGGVITNALAGFRCDYNGSSDGLGYVQSDHNDVVWLARHFTTNQMCIDHGSSDNDCMIGANGGFIGSVPIPTDGPLADHNDATLVFNLDNDSGNITSTHSPGMYYLLAANRTNPLTALQKPTNVTSIVATPGANTVNVTWTTGIKARSRLLVGTSAGVMRANATTTSPWKYHGILDPELVDFTLPVTSHSHDQALPPGTYYAVPECYDPCGRRFLGAETSFTIAAAGGGGSVFGGGVVR